MTPESPPRRRRAGGRWAALVALALVALAAGAWLAVRAALAGRAEAAAAARLPRVTHQTVLGEVRSVARLATAEATLRDVVTIEQTNRFYATKRALLVVISYAFKKGLTRAERDGNEMFVDDGVAN